MDRLRQKLVPFRGLGFRQPVEALGIQAREPNQPILSADEPAICKPLRGTSTFRGIQRIRKGHRRPLAAIR